MTQNRKSFLYGTIVYFIMCFAPVSYLASKIQAGESALLSSRRLELMGNTLLIGILTAVLCMLIGMAAAQGIRCSRIADKICRWFFLLFAAVPPYIYSLSYMTVARIWRWNPVGMFPCIVVEVLAYLPVCTGISLLALERLPRENIELGLLMNEEKKVFWDIILPSVFPQTLASGGLVFILSITDFSIPSLFQVNVYSMEIFSDYSAAGQIYHSFLLSLPLMAAAAVIMLVCVNPMKRILMPAPSERAPKVKGGTGVRIFSVIGLLTSILQVLFPLVALSPYLPSVWEAICLSGEELAVSCVIGILAGMMAIVPSSLTFPLILYLG